MKFAFLSSLLLLLQFALQSQSFLNGSFEIHTFNTCTLGTTDAIFSGKMAHTNAFGKTHVGSNQYVGNVSVQDSGCSVVPQHGDWCIGLHSGFGPQSDAVTLKMSDSLVPGTTYYISFFIYGNLGFQNYQSDVRLGESMIDSDLGTQIGTATPSFMEWKYVHFPFVATKRAKFISVKIIPGYNSWNQIDNFVIATYPLTGIYDHSSNDFFSFFPNPGSNVLNIRFANDPEPCTVDVYDQLGRQVLPKRLVNSAMATLDVSGLANGIYNVQITNGIATVYKKFIVAR